jgi:hypothetical protein
MRKGVDRLAGLPARARCPLTGSFAAATAVQPVTAGEWAGSIAPGWEIGGNANGGYLLAMAARALAGAAGRPDPVTVTAHYLSPGRTGDVRIATQILKDGKRFATGTATMFAGDRTVLAVLGTLGDRPRPPGLIGAARPGGRGRPSRAGCCPCARPSRASRRRRSGR